MPPDPRGVDRPTVLLDAARVRRNIARMADRARAAGVRLRPHMKTHQSLAIGAWLADAGAAGCTVSSVPMAAAFADAGWDDVTLAVLASPRQIGLLDDLAARIRLGLLVDAPGPLAALAAGLRSGADLWLKVDAGYGRTGVRWDDARLGELADLAASAAPLRLRGLLTHAGDAYAARGREEILAVHRRTLERMAIARDELAARGHPGLEISVGDTPTASVADRFAPAAEIRPGNYVFNDLMQLEIGSCAAADLAVAVACPVLGVYPDRGTIVLHGGAVHLGKEFLERPGGGRCYGLAEPWDGGPLPELTDRAPLVSLSQEHGTIAAPPELLGSVRPGDLMAVFPVHSCLTCDLHAGYRTLEGEWMPRITTRKE